MDAILHPIDTLTTFGQAATRDYSDAAAAATEFVGDGVDAVRDALPNNVVTETLFNPFDAAGTWWKSFRQDQDSLFETIADKAVAPSINLAKWAVVGLVAYAAIKAMGMFK